MLFESSRIPYQKGTILESAVLNRDFDLAHSLLNACASRYCNGIISGMITHVADNGLALGPGVFRLNGVLGWLKEEYALQLPPKSSWVCLWLNSTEEKDKFHLDWQEENYTGPGICLCRLKMTDQSLLRDSWLFTEKSPENIPKWLGHMKGVDYVQLEYAMAASFGQRPTLLPDLQKALSCLCQPKEIKLWLLTGLLPIMDYFNCEEWQEALERFIMGLEGEKDAPMVVRAKRNLAG